MKFKIGELYCYKHSIVKCIDISTRRDAVKFKIIMFKHSDNMFNSWLIIGYEYWDTLLEDKYEPI